MDFKKFLNDVKPHVIAILAFFLIGYVYYIKTFNGFIHKEEDVTQGLLKSTEIRKYTEKDGEFPGWTNSIFSGMPSVLIQGKVSGNQIKSFNYLTPVNSTSYPFKILFLSFIGFYLLMNAFKIKPLYGALAAVAYGFATYSISSVEAAHYTKVLAMALMPAILASLHWLFSGRYLLGGITLAFNLSMQIYSFHYQITFYSIICMLVMGVFYVVNMIMNGQIKQMIIATIISIVAVGIGVACNITKIESTSKFSENTMRGGNDMAKVDKNVKLRETGQNGLNRDYAFGWSYAKGETFTLLIPGFYGGSSGEVVTEKSSLYEKFGEQVLYEMDRNGNIQTDIAGNNIRQKWSLYHGDLISTSGPIYVGAIIVFLFFIGVVIVKDPIKWPIILLTLISFILGWGRNFSIINNFLFDHLPYFDKFRTPMMGFCIAQVTIPLLGFLGIKTLYDNWQIQKTVKVTQAKTDAVKPATKTKEANELWEKVKMTYIIVGGFCLLMAIAGPNIIDMSGSVDEQYKQGGGNNLISALKDDRASLMRKDSLRSFLYIGIAFGLFWAWYNNKMKKSIALALIAGYAAIDLIGIDWRYLSWDKFIHPKGTVTDIVPDDVDKQIMADKELHFRVFDLTKDPFNDNSGAAFYKMVGGYDPAKLSRYQDVISELLSKQEYQNQTLNMLNCKYLIGGDSSGRRGLMPRLTNNGNAWFIKQLSASEDAAKEMQKLKAIDNKTEATFNSSFNLNKSLASKTFEVDSMAGAKLLSYHPDTLNYNIQNSKEGYLVFSEIYYDNWKAEIDGKSVALNKVDYTLRGLNVPAGSHKIKLYFDKGKNTTDYIEKMCSVTILIGMLILVLFWLSTYFKKEKTLA